MSSSSAAAFFAGFAEEEAAGAGAEVAADDLLIQRLLLTHQKKISNDFLLRRFDCKDGCNVLCPTETVWMSLQKVSFESLEITWTNSTTIYF